MYRVWYSTESFADYIIDHTELKTYQIKKSKIYESDANNPSRFHTMPDHIRKILYLDAPDLIIEFDSEPLLTIEISTEAGSGHNVFQRFARIAASVENEVPAFYIYPEGAIITRQGAQPRWDVLNPIIFKAMEDIMNIYNIPALLYYFPTDIHYFPNPNAINAPHLSNKGLHFDKQILRYPGCPDSQSSEMKLLFSSINEVINITKNGVRIGQKKLLQNLIIRQRRAFMNNEFSRRSNGININQMSPLSATIMLDTKYLLNYLSQYEDNNYSIGELLRSRQSTVFYKVNAKFRGDPYPGALASVDYLLCREGKTFEERRNNLVLVFGDLNIIDNLCTIDVLDNKKSTINDFFKDVQNSEKHNLLKCDYFELAHSKKPRYFMQVRYGSTYSKVKHIRVYSYFADAILFPDGTLWRDA